MSPSPTLDALCAEAAVHALACAAARRALAAARANRGEVLQTGSELRQEAALASELERVRMALEGCSKRSAGDALSRSLAALQALEPRCGESDSAGQEVVRLHTQLRSAHAAAWKDWCAHEADTFFAGARALSLQPPGELSSGVDGLERERAAHQVRDDSLLCTLSPSVIPLTRADGAAAARGGRRDGQGHR